jgi:Tfp pilus assembly protein PilW
MDDAFRLVAAQMPRTRRLTPFDVRLIALAVAVVLLIAVFSTFLVSRQRVADAERARAIANQRAAELATTQDASTIGGATPARLLDGQAREAATAAVSAATAIATAHGATAATAAALSGVDHDLVFVDGPSTASSVVSVYAGSAGWAAAVHDGGDGCVWVAFTQPGRERYGTGTACTGVAALAADSPSW